MQRRLVAKVVVPCLVMAVLTVLPAAPADAARSITVSATFASPTVPGQVAPAGFEITNTSTDVPFSDSLTVTEVRLIPGCGTPTAGCPVPDPDVFRLNGPFRTLTSTGGQCRDTWTATVTNPSTGEVRFTPDDGPVVVGATDRCFVSFTTTTLRVPSVDASTAAGLQTAVHASVTATASDGSPFVGGSASLATVNPTPQARFAPVTPARIHDTRGRPVFPAPGFGEEIQVAGQAGVPADATAVVLNVTALSHAGSPPSYMTLWPTGHPRPAVSNLNYVAGEIIPNLVTVAIGHGGRVTYYNHSGRVDVIVDVFGYYAASGVSAFTAVQPDRILDTRTGNGAPAALVGPAGVVNVQVSGRGGVPAGATAVVMNVTAGMASGSSTFVTAWPTGSPRPVVSNLNPVLGQFRPNLVVVRLGTDGKVSLRNQSGQVHLLADVAGYFGPDGDTFSTVYPERQLDTRVGTGAPAVRVPAGGTVDLQVSGRSGVAAGATAVVLNVTAVSLQGASRSWLTAWPTGQPMPLASNLNMVAGQVVPNSVVAKIGANGRVSISNAAGNVDILADVVGYYTG